MATFIKLLDKYPLEIVEETYKRRNEADESRLKEYKAAVKIQSWYRRIQTKCYLRYESWCCFFNVSLHKADSYFSFNKVFIDIKKELFYR